jgi:hypothetical protein
VGVRVAIVSTPRSGNTWLRSLLTGAYGAPDLAIHNPADTDWTALPRDCVIQVHWHRTPSFLRTLQDAGFRVVTMRRHPLDVLLSILQFCQHDRSTLRWLDGEKGNERPIYGAMPGSAAFADYATGGRAAALLSVSTEWWQAPDVCRLRYEDLVADPAGAFDRVVGELGHGPRRPLREVTRRATAAKLQARVHADYHCWQGRPGLWKSLLTAAVAEPIARAHPGAFGCDYVCDPDPDLTPLRADTQWIELAGMPVADRLYNFARTLERLSESQAALAAARAELQSVQGSYHELYAQHHNATTQLSRYQELGPVPLGVALYLRNFMHCHTLLSAAVKGGLRLAAYPFRLGRVLVRAGRRLGSSLVRTRGPLAPAPPSGREANVASDAATVRFHGFRA